LWNASRQILADATEGETIAAMAEHEMEEAAEGRVITAMHRRYERNSALTEAA
jgi:predicted HNH restriction endonuclease